MDESFWLPAIAVADVDDALVCARRLGATVHVGAERVDGFGRYGVITDPEGAPVTLLWPSSPLGGGRGPGSWAWVELWCDDPDAEASFYAEVVGWERGAVDVGSRTYTAFHSGERHRAGLVQISREYERVEPAWVPYIAVGDLERKTAEVRSLGGSVLLEPTAELGDGRVALVADPSGAAFFLLHRGPSGGDR